MAEQTKDQQPQDSKTPAQGPPVTSGVGTSQHGQPAAADENPGRVVLTPALSNVDLNVPVPRIPGPSVEEIKHSTDDGAEQQKSAADQIMEQAHAQAEAIIAAAEAAVERESGALVTSTAQQEELLGQLASQEQAKGNKDVGRGKQGKKDDALTEKQQAAEAKRREEGTTVDTPKTAGETTGNSVKGSTAAAKPASKDK